MGRISTLPSILEHTESHTQYFMEIFLTFSPEFLYYAKIETFFERNTSLIKKL